MDIKAYETYDKFSIHNHLKSKQWAQLYAGNQLLIILALLGLLFNILHLSP